MNPHLSALLLSTLGLAGCAIAPTTPTPSAAEKPITQKIVVIKPEMGFTEEEKKNALASLARLRPEVVTFVKAFPNSTFSVWREPRSDWIHVDLTARPNAEIEVSLWFSAKYDPVFTRALDSKFEILTACLIREFYAPLQPGEVRSPTYFQLEELDALCANPAAALAQKRREPKHR